MQPWTLRRRDNIKYPDLPTFDVLEPNEDAGKAGVCYSGEWLTVVTDIDSEKYARLIAAAPQLLEACRLVLDRFGADYNPHGPVLEAVRRAIAAAEGR